MKFPLWLRALLLSPSVVAIAAATRLLLMANLDPVVAAKLATTGGVIGTLTGTIVPLLPPLMPLLVVWLVIARRPFLVVLAALSTALVSPAKVTGKEAARWTLREVVKLSDPAIWSRLATQDFVIKFLGSHSWAIFPVVLSFFAAFAAAPRYLHKEDPKDRDKQAREDVKEHEEDLTPVKIGGRKIRPPNKFDHKYRIRADQWGNPLDREKTGQALRSPDMLRLERDQQEWRRQARKALKRRRKSKSAARTMLLRPLWAAWWSLCVAFPALIVVNHVYPVPVGLDPSFQLRRPWTPSEVITTKSGFREVGYMIATEDKWSVILTEKQRTIDYLPSEDIVSRSVCSLERVQGPDVGPLVNLPGVHESTSPLCPAGGTHTK